MRHMTQCSGGGQSETHLAIESTVRGHHVYKRRWTPAIGEEFNVLAEAGNIHDRFAVAVYRDDSIVGHLPREIAQTCWYFFKER